jgi:hypothetical protein
MSGAVQTSLFGIRQSLDLLRVESVVACQVDPERHASDTHGRDVDGAEPNSQLVGV